MKPHVEDAIEMESFTLPVTTQTFCVIGQTPFITAAMSAKAKAELFFPAKKKNKAERESTIKHDPLREFMDCFYLTKPSAPTAFGMPAVCFKKAMATAALVTPGATKSDINRLVWVSAVDLVPIYGIPQLFLAITRSANMNRTPDMRSRPIVPQWACVVSVQFLKDMIPAKKVAELMMVAGYVSGIGDFRVEKGAGNYGQWRLCASDDPDFRAIIETGGREAQQAAMADPAPYDHETEKMMAWFNDEVRRRGAESKLAAK